MTSQTPSPLLVALLQTAESVPIFLLALPAGALADIVGRRRLLLFTEIWLCLASTALGVFTLLDLTTPTVLLIFAFTVGVATAVNVPAWQAITQELVGDAVDVADLRIPDQDGVSALNVDRMQFPGMPRPA
jgi:MFS family permease